MLLRECFHFITWHSGRLCLLGAGDRSNARWQAEKAKREAREKDKGSGKGKGHWGKGEDVAWKGKGKGPAPPPAPRFKNCEIRAISRLS